MKHTEMKSAGFKQVDILSIKIGAVRQKIPGTLVQEGQIDLGEVWNFDRSSKVKIGLVRINTRGEVREGVQIPVKNVAGPNTTRRDLVPPPLGNSTKMCD